MRISLCLILVSCFGQLLGLEVKPCYIADNAKHESNKKLLSIILEKELAQLASKKPSEKAHYLSSRIIHIADALLKKGFFSEAYAIPMEKRDALLSFNSFALWEGDKNGSESLPLTFFVYVWPPKHLALQYNSSDPQNCYYASIIHSHPIPCAFAILQGTLIQKNYAEVINYPIDKVVRLINEERIQLGQGSVDDLKSPFIHQLYCNDMGSRPCISLHAYGLSSAEKVMHYFKETLSQCTYKDIEEN